ncbi:hypothetical protein I4F81_011104 [Pyropia yezoensis]|uniref:Uncharacterized protein n=1 Tax=Pyropia yezoensis TaxID=2788 RepID=A0ACC3CEL8_PYRYE|nr:hypothetical protein I4F81_011104 [Neopyropia yezoensis]
MSVFGFGLGPPDGGGADAHGRGGGGGDGGDAVGGGGDGGGGGGGGGGGDGNGGGAGGDGGAGGGAGADVDTLLAQPLSVGTVHLSGLVRTREAFVRRVVSSALADTAAAAAAEAAAAAASAAAAAAAAAAGPAADPPPPAPGPTFGDAIEGLSEAVERLRSTGAFASVTAVLDEAPPGAAPDGAAESPQGGPRVADVRVDVVERKLYALQTTTSVEGSGERQASLEGKLRWRNVFGNAEELALSAGWWGSGSTPLSSLPTATPSFSLESTLTTPFPAPGVAATTLRAHQTTANHAAASSYTLVSRGLSLSADTISAGTFTAATTVRTLTDLSPVASLSVREEAGTSTLTALTHTIDTDTRDSAVGPTTGWRAGLTTTLAGVLRRLGDVRHARVEADAQGHVPVGASGITASLAVRAGAAVPWGGDPAVLRLWVHSVRRCTMEPANASAASPPTPHAQAAYASCGACKYRKEFAPGSTHYFKDCSLVKDDIQCSHGLDKGHVRCPKCTVKGHHPNTVALDTRLFKRKITDNGVSLTKKPHIKLSSRFLVCKAFNDAFFEAAAQRARARCAAEHAQKEEKDRRCRGLVANLVGAAAPRTTVVTSLQDIGSAASVVAPANMAVAREQARCADAGMSALASARAGAVTNTTGQPSGVTSDDATDKALALISSRQADAEELAAARLRQTALALEAPRGSSRLYIFYFPGASFISSLSCIFSFPGAALSLFVVFRSICIALG